MAVAKGLRRGARKRAFAGLAVLGVIAIAGLVAGWGASPAETLAMTAADVVAMRFPADWNDDDTTASVDDTTASVPPATSATYALASAGEAQPLESSVLFSPYAAVSPSHPRSNVAAVPQPVRPTVAMDQAPVRKTEIKIETQIRSEPKLVSIRPAATEPERRPAPRHKDSGALFNDAQLASIKSRLKLTIYQQEYWPPVESALREIGWKATHDDARKIGARAGQPLVLGIDPNSSEVLRLKSAAFPLIMSMNEDQKHEVRMLAQVMGLDRVAASF